VSGWVFQAYFRVGAGQTIPGLLRNFSISLGDSGS
jgi:hypothetical protein